MRAKKVVCFHKLIRTINIVSNTGYIRGRGFGCTLTIKRSQDEWHSIPCWVS